jgi:hypothetical protein
VTVPAELEAALLELRVLLARPDNDFSWSSWRDQADALAEIDGLLARLRAGRRTSFASLLAPTGPLQEVASSSGWGSEFLALARRIEAAAGR